ncbi:low molecular weight protein-tyrosine-phosphatase [Dendronalium sp. ChiSLP03b]|uniref:low molecular weight protein-tyrosine-phosphatase n=1 Tax=Dendronalium sp. ChiSLP03b TaxID=3075381 RepID=UPI002AD99454|nr:low molecular weight protein-tyrosine-phosphatase [Dendronalium sp. ChiSLP03b]
MNHLIDQAGLSEHILCDSAGTSSYHIDSPPDQRMSAAATTKLGIKLRGRARQFQKSDFQSFDVILAMDLENFEDILALDPTGQHHDKVFLMCEFCSRHTLKEVPDPYYGGVEGFNQVIDLLIDACEGLLQHITSQQSIA